ncbi:MAG: divergent polysaccharide deacetylase family protein, partial [Rhodospirillaceae bacterium]|nr:divergent polysaccharide deacetylase family protein [Rhodospirillaceae bacterium]
IAIGHPYDTTISALKKWLPTLSPRGFILVPVSAIVRHRLEAG